LTRGSGRGGRSGFTGDKIGRNRQIIFLKPPTKVDKLPFPKFFFGYRPLQNEVGQKRGESNEGGGENHTEESFNSKVTTAQFLHCIANKPHWIAVD
jgi:hypothetical protein